MTLKELMSQTLDKKTWEALQACTIANSESDLTLADIQRAYNLLKSSQPMLYYALSEYLPDNSEFYKMPIIGDDNKHVWCMRPSRFSEFEFFARQAGYKLIEFRYYVQHPKLQTCL